MPSIRPLGERFRIRGAARLRRPLETRNQVPAAPAAEQPTSADEAPPSPCETDLKFTEFPSAFEAIQHAATNGGKAIRMGGRNLVASEPDAQFLAALGIEFAYLCDHKGQIVTVPVND